MGYIQVLELSFYASDVNITLYLDDISTPEVPGYLCEISWIILANQCQKLFYRHGLTSIPAGLRNYISSEVWDEINYPFLNYSGSMVEVLEWIATFIPHFWNICNYISMLGLKLEKGPFLQIDVRSTTCYSKVFMAKNYAELFVWLSNYSYVCTPTSTTKYKDIRGHSKEKFAMSSS